MFNYWIGLITGLFLGFTLLVSFIISDIKIDLSIITNIIIATATCIVTYIHIDSLGRQRKIRAWEINSPTLLNLADTLSKINEQIENVIWHLHTGEGEREEDNKLYAILDKQINKAINVYSSLMSKSLISDLQAHQAELQRIRCDFEQNCLDAVDAYESQLSSSKVLYERIMRFIAEIADVKVT